MACLWSTARLSKQKTKIFLITRSPTYRKPDSCFRFVSTKRAWKQICNLICKNYNYGYFHAKISLKVLVKSLLRSDFFTNCLNPKFVNKKTGRMLTANPHQPLVHYLKSFRTVAIVFWVFQDFPIYLSKCFCSLLNSPNTIFLVSLTYREMITVQTVTLYKKLFFH